MYLALLFLVILIAILGAISFSIREKQSISDVQDETKAIDFEIIES